MRVFGIILMTLAALLLTFWEDLMAFLVVLGLCSSCDKKSTTTQPKAATTASTSGSTNYAYINSTAQVPEVDVSIENAACEIFQNHTANIPHLYSNSRQNELVGTVFGESQPQFNAYGTWKLMQPMGASMFDSTKKFWAYREPFAGATNVRLRTREGCSHYDDVRNTAPTSFTGTTPNLPSIGAISNHVNLNLVIDIAGDLTAPASSYNVWLIRIKDHHDNLQFRVNGGGWQNTTQETEEEHGHKSNIDHNMTPAIVVGKDFILDFTKDGGTTVDRYKVIRNNAGGHFSATATLIRAEDGKVYVTTFQGDKHVAMTLGNTSHKGWGNFFDLGYLAPNDYTFQLKSASTGYILDDQIHVIVR